MNPETKSQHNRRGPQVPRAPHPLRATELTNHEPRRSIDSANPSQPRNARARPLPPLPSTALPPLPSPPFAATQPALRQKIGPPPKAHSRALKRAPLAHPPQHPLEMIRLRVRTRHDIHVPVVRADCRVNTCQAKSNSVSARRGLSSSIAAHVLRMPRTLGPPCPARNSNGGSFASRNAAALVKSVARIHPRAWPHPGARLGVREVPSRCPKRPSDILACR